MNCLNLNNLTGWDCLPAGDHSIKAVSPLTLGDDGQLASFYLARPSDNSYFLTDAGETAMHAAAFGIELTRSRLAQINQTAGVSLAKFDSDWSITSSGPIEDAKIALWDAAKLAMSLSFLSEKWKPKFNQIRFRTLVEDVLVQTLGPKNIRRHARVQGMSGHTAEFPFAIRSENDELYFIEPIALLDNKKIDWNHIYQVHGKLSDVKQADAKNHRLVIIEDGAPKLDFGRAATLLAQSADIQEFHYTQQWARDRSAGA